MKIRAAVTGSRQAATIILQANSIFPSKYLARIPSIAMQSAEMATSNTAIRFRLFLLAVEKIPSNMMAIRFTANKMDMPTWRVQVATGKKWLRVRRSRVESTQPARIWKISRVRQKASREAYDSTIMQIESGYTDQVTAPFLERSITNVATIPERRRIAVTCHRIRCSRRFSSSAGIPVSSVF